MDPSNPLTPENSLIRSVQPAVEVVRSAPIEAYVAPPAQQATVMDYWRILNKHKWIVVTSVVVLVSLAALISLRATPKYEARARIAIHREASDVLGFQDMGSTGSEDWDYTVAIDTQVRVLQSDTLAQEVIRKLQLDKNPSFAGELANPQKDPEASSEPPLSQAERDEIMIGIFRGSMSVNAIPNSRIVEIRFTNPDPDLAARVTNTLAQNYIEHNFKTKFESTMQTSEWLSRQLADLQLKVETTQEKLVRYQQEHGILGVDEKQNIITAKLDELNRELTAAEADRIQKEARHRLASSGEADLVARAEANTLLDKLRSQEADLRTQYSQVTTQFGPSYPRVVELRNQLTQIEGAIKDEIRKIAGRIESDYRGAMQREGMLGEALEKQKTLANKLNENAIQYNILKRDVETSRNLYEGLLQKLKEASVTAGLRSSNVRIVDAARVPTVPSEPNIPRNILLGLLMGLAGGIGLAFVREFLDNTVRTPEQVEIVAALPSLGIIPMGLMAATASNGRKGRRLSLSVGNGKEKDNGQGARVELISHFQPKSELAESYRALRTSILLSSLGAPPKVILVTSALPQEGKTTTSINSAIVLAQRGARVLLVDADMRRPSIHRALGLRSRAGLSNLLTGADSGDSLIVPAPQVPNLFVLPAGPPPPQPAELLGSLLMQNYLAQWRKQFDHIVVDTPPTVSVTDAVLLSVQADAVILVIRSGQTTKEALRRARDLLLQVNARVMGVVVNAVDLRGPGSYYYYYYGSKYGHYYSDSSEPQE
ncbi:MAG: GumC family protein [Terriglobales bacterium]